MTYAEETTGSNWHRVWSNPERLSVNTSEALSLSDLIAADGFNTGFGDIDPGAWEEFVEDARVRLGLERGNSVFEIGCGSGAFLHPLHQGGMQVGGVDYSATLIDLARTAMPEGSFDVMGAVDVDPSDRYDASVACSVFLYFPDHDYAERVVRLMCQKSRRSVGILDIPDINRRDEALAYRRASVGSDEEYERRYAGLEHLFYEPEWFESILSDSGAKRIHTSPQRISGYANAEFRFNVIAELGTQ